VNGEKFGVLLIGEGSGSFAGIIRRLEKSGCRCQVANSYAEAQHLVEEDGFELVLSVIPPRENAMSLLTVALAGTHANIFYAHRVEDGCWWLPVLRDGLQCFGAPALRPSEFTNLLDRVVLEIREHEGKKLQPAASKPRPLQRESSSGPKEPAKTQPVRAA